MKKDFKQVLVLVVVLVVLALVFLIKKNFDDKNSFEKIKEEQMKNRLLPQLNSFKIDSFKINSLDGEIIGNKIEDYWISGNEFNISSKSVDNFFKVLERITYYKKAKTYESEKSSSYGLDNPKAEYSFYSESDQILNIKVGGINPSGNRYYILLNNESLYIMERNTNFDLYLKQKDFINKQIFNRESLGEINKIIFKVQEESRVFRRILKGWEYKGEHDVILKEDSKEISDLLKVIRNFRVDDVEKNLTINKKHSFILEVFYEETYLTATFYESKKDNYFIVVEIDKKKEFYNSTILGLMKYFKDNYTIDS